MRFEKITRKSVLWVGLAVVVVTLLATLILVLGPQGNTTGTYPTTGATEPSGETTPGTTAPTSTGTKPTETLPEGSETTAPTVAPSTPTTPTETVPVTTVPTTTVPQESQHVHRYMETRQEPTCTQDGVIWSTCECGKKYKDYITMLGHDWSEWVITKEPTTESTGDRERSCARCGLKEKDFVAPLDKETGEKYVSYIDPKLSVEHIDSAVWYRYKELSVGVLDARTWGEPPSIYVEEDGSLRVVYFQKNGEKVELLHSPVANKFHRGVILEDGTFITVLVGDFG